MSAVSGAVLIGVGNSFRCDDGIGPALAAAIGELDLPGVSVIISDGEPSRLLDAWSGARLAVVVDAIRMDGGEAGQIHRHCVTDGRMPEGWTSAGSASTHALGISEAIDLAQVMGRTPERLVVFCQENLRHVPPRSSATNKPYIVEAVNAGHTAKPLCLIEVPPW